MCDGALLNGVGDGSVLDNDPTQVLQLMCSTSKLQRDRTTVTLQHQLPQWTRQQVVTLLHRCLSDVQHSSWYTVFGCVVTTRVVLEVKGDVISDELMWTDLLRICGDNLSHNEARVRTAVGELLGCLSQYRGECVYEAVHDSLSSLISSSISGDDEEQPDDDTSSVCSRDSADVFANTTSWTVLETCIRCVQKLLHSTKIPINSEMVAMVMPAVKHSNRFVREAVFSCISEFLADSVTVSQDVGDISVLRQSLCDVIATGMDDNWSQVRMAASVSCRSLLCGHSVLSLNNDDNRQILSLLVPRICLNRYYVAEGVKLYNQKTWEQLSAGRGKQMVEMYIDHVVEFYVLSMTAENHAVREAACYCVRELVDKISASTVRPHVDRVMSALIVCFDDDSWPVRDTACVAVGRMVCVFSDECTSYMSRLYPLMLSNLFDNIASVRQGGADTLADVVSVYKEAALEQISTRVKEGLCAVKEQSSETDTECQLEPVSGVCDTDQTSSRVVTGVIRRHRAGVDDARHTNQTMYSCGSLAPKMRAGGCSASHHFRRPPQPWEICDGCVRLLAALSPASCCSTMVTQSLPDVARAASYHHYSRHVQLVETVCLVLPTIAQAIGKRNFKTHLELFFDTIFYAVKSDNQLTADSGVKCVEQLSKLLGAGIFRGRVEMYNNSYVTIVDRIMR